LCLHNQKKNAAWHVEEQGTGAMSSLLKLEKLLKGKKQTLETSQALAIFTESKLIVVTWARVMLSQKWRQYTTLTWTWMLSGQALGVLSW
jgi:hypothetical protein